MGGLADGGVVHAEIAADGSDDDIAGVESDPDLDTCPVGVTRFFRVLLDRFLHAQRRVAGAHGMVLVGDGRAEERHDAIPHDLVHGAFKAVDRVHHALEHGVEDLPRLLGIAVGEELHRALEVGEEDGHLFALAFEGALGCEDLLRQMLRRVRLWRGELRCRRWPRGSTGQRRAATIAELAASLYLCPTARANRCECRAAFPTETGTVAVICLAPGALHAGASEHSDWRRSER